LLFIRLKKNSPASKNAGSKYIGEWPGLVPSAGQKIPVQPGTFHLLLAGNRFPQVGKGAENTKENSRCIPYFKESKKRKAESSVKAKNMD
jgi:hypothetical protein